MTGTSTPKRSRIAAPDAAGRRIGIDRQQRHDRAGLRPDVRRVDAAVGAHEAVARLGDEHAVGPSGRPAAPRAGRPRPGARRGPKRSANATASGRGSTVVRSTTAPSALETTFWVTTRTSASVSGRTVRAPLERVADQRREVVAGLDLRDPVEGDDLDPPGVSRHRARPARRPARGTGRPACRGRATAVRRARRSSVAGGRGGVPVGDAAVAAECEVDHVRRREQEAVRAAPVAVGDDRDEWRWRLAEDVEQVGHGRGRHGRKVGGQHEQCRGAVLERRGAGLREPVVEAHDLPGGSRVPRPRPRASRTSSSGRDHDRLGDPRRPEGRGEGALQEADHQVAALLGVEHLAEPRLRALERARPGRPRRRVPSCRPRELEHLASKAGTGRVVGHDRVRDPGPHAERFDCCGQLAVHRVQHEAVRERPRRCAATPSADGSWPSDTSIRSAGPFSARPPTMPLTATIGVPRRRRGGERLAHPGQRRGSGRSTRSGSTAR